VTALDCSANRLREAKRLWTGVGLRIRWVLGDIERSWPIRSGHFDLMVVVHYWSDRVLARAKSALKPNGWLVFETFGAQGENWRQLPQVGAVARAVAPAMELVEFHERPVGPGGRHAVVRMLCRR